MWRYTLLAATAVAAAASPNDRRDQTNSSTVALSSSSILQASSSSHASSQPSPITISLPDYKAASSGTSVLSSQPSSRSSSIDSPGDSLVQRPPPPSTISTRVESSSSTTSRPLTSTYVPSRSASSSKSDSKSLVSESATNSSAITSGICTGCVIQAFNPVTTFFKKDDKNNPWTSVVVTETIIEETITYFDGSTIDTVIIETRTLNHTTTVLGEWNDTITATTPNFVIQPTPGMYLTVDAGPTYVIYNNLNGGLDEYVDRTYTALKQTLRTCVPAPTSLTNWEPAAAEDWSYFVQTYTTKPPRQPMNLPVSLPAKLLEYLKQDPDIISQFRGSDIATCTTRATNGLDNTGVPVKTSSAAAYPSGPPPPPPPSGTPANPTATEAPEEPQPTEPISVPVGSFTTGTFISKTIETTSTHVTRQGCLRCQNTKLNPPQPPTNAPAPAPTFKPDDKPKPDEKPDQKPDEQPDQNPDEKPRPNDNPSPSITIGDNVFPVNTGQPTQNQDRPNEQNQAPPVIIIGSETFTPGQTKTINGVPVVVPTDGGGSRVVVDGSTVAINPGGPTGAPILKVESYTVTANDQGHFVVGTQTLSPGGPAITVNGNTYSLAPSGTVAVINGVTQTLANAPVLTQAPVLTVNGQAVTASVIGGSTLFVVGPGQTLTPGGVLTVSGTTYSLPSSGSGSVVVINGVTSTLTNGPVTAAPALTIDGKQYSAIVKDGTTQYVLGPGTTLKPGEAVTISGTTYSLDPKGTALVINGQTSTIPKTPASNSASITRSSSASSSRSSSRSSTSSGRDAGDLIASGIGETSKGGAGMSAHAGGFDKWVESLMIGAAGWILVLL